jgi:hypothetical protein
MRRIAATTLVVLLFAGGWVAAGRNQIRTRNVVVAVRDIHPYAIVGAADLAVERRSIAELDDDTTPDMATLLGEVSVVPVAKGAPVRPSAMLTAGLLADRVLVTVAAPTAPDAPGRGELADLILSPRLPTASSAVIDSVLVVDATEDKAVTTYTLGMMADDRATVAGLLGVSDARVTVHLPLP